jgi:hypothetical protein
MRFPFSSILLLLGVYFPLFFFIGCSSEISSCEGVEPVKCLLVYPACQDDKKSFSCRVSLLNEYCGFAKEPARCAARILKVTVDPEFCKNDKDRSRKCNLASKEIVDDLVAECKKDHLPHSCAWIFQGNATISEDLNFTTPSPLNDSLFNQPTNSPESEPFQTTLFYSPSSSSSTTVPPIKFPLDKEQVKRILNETRR